MNAPDLHRTWVTLRRDHDLGWHVTVNSSNPDAHHSAWCITRGGALRWARRRLRKLERAHAVDVTREVHGEAA